MMATPATRRKQLRSQENNGMKRATATDHEARKGKVADVGAPLVVTAAFAVTTIAELRRPLRLRRSRTRVVMARSLTTAAATAVAASALQRPLLTPLLERVKRDQLGLLQQVGVCRFLFGARLAFCFSTTRSGGGTSGIIVPGFFGAFISCTTSSWWDWVHARCASTSRRMRSRSESPPTSSRKT